MNSLPLALMRRLALCLPILLASCRVASPGTVAPSGERYDLVWSDEFTGDGPLDTAHWAFENGFVRNRNCSGTSPKTPRG
jgi:hypothetical protein